MATAPADASRPPASPFGTIVTVALAIALAWVAARGTWTFLAPAAVAPAPRAESAVDLAAVAQLFGGQAPSGAAVTAGGSGLRLKGVVAPSPAATGSAVFNAGGKDVAVALGGEVQPGVKVVEIGSDHAIVSRAGVRERIDLEVRMAAVPRAAGGKAAGFRLPVTRSGPNAFAFARKDLDDALKDPGQLNYLGRLGTPQGGGVRLDEAPPGSLASRLGLQPGDIIRKVNGQAVGSAGDLARVYQQFANTSLIQAEVQRGTATVQLSYTIN